MTYPGYTGQEVALLRKRFATASHAELTTLFPGRSLASLKVKASKLGIRRDPGARENASIKYGDSVIGHMTETDIFYLAGIIDGEGCLSASGRWNPNGVAYVISATVTITNTSKRLIDWIDAQIPAKVYSRDDNRVRTCYNWRMHGSERVRIFCREIAPYLLVKREQAELIGIGWSDMTTDQRFALIDRLSELKRG